MLPTFAEPSTCGGVRVWSEPISRAVDECECARIVSPQQSPRDTRDAFIVSKRWNLQLSNSSALSDFRPRRRARQCHGFDSALSFGAILPANDSSTAVPPADHNAVECDAGVVGILTFPCVAFLVLRNPVACSCRAPEVQSVVQRLRYASLWFMPPSVVLTTGPPCVRWVACSRHAA